MSGSLLEIKKQIGGVKNTRKITKAMKLVAASKMQKFQKRALSSRHYVWNLLQVLDRNSGAQTQSIYTEERAEGATLFVLYTSDKGLCGSLNNKLIQALFRSEQWLGLPESERMLVTLGKKSHDFAKNTGIPVDKHYTGIPEELPALEAVKVVDGILDLWREGKVKRVVFVAPHYKNSFTFYPVLKTFLPFTEDTVESIFGPLDEEDRPVWEGDDNESMIFTPEEDTVLEKLYEQLIYAVFVQSFLELKASEYSSRMIAMQNATDAADKMIASLTLVFNKARQSAITQEIAELIGAKMALEEED